MSTASSSAASAIPDSIVPVSAGLAKAPQVTPRRWYERGHADHGWLKTFHTFAFASYRDYKHAGFSDLLVINEDRVAPDTGFGTHPHANMNIFSYLVSGELTHKDSLGNLETLKRSDIQFTNAGTGIRHSEYNNNPKEEVHFLQIWYLPDQQNLKPLYYTSQTPDAMKANVLKTLVKPLATFSAEEQQLTGLLPAGRPIPANNSLVTRATILSPGNKVTHVVGTDTELAADSTALGSTERWLYVHVVQTSGYKDPRTQQRDSVKPQEARVILRAADGKETTLAEGDGAYIKGTIVGEALEVESVGGSNAEVLLFDLRARDAHM